VDDGWLKKLFGVDVVAVGPIEGVVTVMVGTPPGAVDAADAAAASFSFFSFSAFSFSNLSFSCRSFSCLSFSSRVLSAAAALSLSTLSLASLSLASFSISFFLFASRTFMIALASNSCFSHFENTFAGAGVRGLPFVLSDKLDMPGESVPLTDDARWGLVLPVKLRARDVEEIRFTAVSVEVEEPKGVIGRPTEVAMECRYDDPLLGTGISYWDSEGE
jgi:hypothetical protein